MNIHRACASVLQHNNYLNRYLYGSISNCIREQKVWLSTASAKIKPAVFENDLNLPSLPVPKLNQTLEKYIASVQPHLNEQELKTTLDVVKKFENGIGKKLQELLVEKAKNTDNWLADWWLNIAYLEYRDPVVVYSSPGLVYPFQNFENEADRVEFTAKLILAAVDYKLLIDSGKLPIDKLGKDLLDMNQYKKIFGTCRIPQPKRDLLTFNPDSKHIVVVSNNHFFKLNVLDDNNQVLSGKQLVEQLFNILDQSESPATEIGVLTSENRDTWAQVYQELIKDDRNQKSVDEIEKSLFLVCLDGPMPAFENENRQTLAAKQFIHGGGSVGNVANRWYDKTVQFVIGQDGALGLTYEHSPSEGQPIAFMTDYLVDYIEKGNWNNIPDVVGVKEAEKLEFNVNEKLEKAIGNANDNIDRLVENLEMDCFTFKSFGKDFVKSQKLSPDSFIQMAIQYAFYRIHKVPGAHYESAATRKYIHGRTETIRSCSVESIAFAQTMLDKSKTDSEKADSLKKAIDSHKRYCVEAVNGFGVDRHLLGLKLIAIENGLDVPELYKDPGFVRSTHMRLSTSQVATNCDGFMCYGPLVDNGYGCCYNPRPKDMNFAVSAFASDPETNATRFREALEQSLLDMHKVLAKTQKSKL